MGLDMYAYKMKFKPKRETDFQEEIANVETEDLAYWRKHPNLHGFMQELYYSKGGTKSTFNCAPVLLNEEDIKNLAMALANDELPETSGFFFGKSSGEEYSEDLKFCQDALNAIKEGYSVYYDSWW